MTDRRDEHRQGPEPFASARATPGDEVDIHFVSGDEAPPPEARFVVRIPEESPEAAIELIRNLFALGKLAVTQNDEIRQLLGVVERRDTQVERLQAQLDLAHTALAACQQENHELREESAGLREENDALRSESLIDPLTKLQSEKALSERHERLNEAIRVDHQVVGRSRRRRPLRFTYAYIDFDGLGDVNTVAGHPIGDRLLEKVGPSISSRIRPEDDAYRKGGDEGIIIMLDEVLRAKEQKDGFRQRIDAAGKVAFEELITELEEEGNQEAAAALRRIALVGYSVGVVAYNRKRHQSIEAVHVEADADLYKQKEARKIAAGIDPASRTNILPDASA